MPVDGKAKCGTCHGIDKSSVAPSFMEISKKYKGDKDSVSKIAASVTMGGRLVESLEKCQQKALTQMMLKSSLFQSLLLIWQNKLGHCKISLQGYSWNSLGHCWIDDFLSLTWGYSFLDTHFLSFF